MRIKFVILALLILLLTFTIHTIKAQCPDIICKTMNITAITNNMISYSYEIKNIGTDTLFLKKAVIQNYVSPDSSKNALSAAGGSFINVYSTDYLMPGQTYTGSYEAYLSVGLSSYPYLVSNFYYIGKTECNTDNNYFIKKAILTPPVDAQFNTDISTGTAPVTVHFTDQSTGTPTSWKWDFNNDGVADTTLQNPSYTYKIPGTYSVKLIASKLGFKDSIIKASYIVVKPPVDAQFSADLTTGIVPLTVHFTDQSTGTPSGWKWDFTNDGVVDATSQHTSFTYQTAGVYSVKLIVSNAESKDTLIKTTYINVSNSSPTGIEKGKEDTWQVYPNPSHGKVYLSFGEKFLYQPIVIEIYNENGKLVFSTNLENQTHFEYDFTANAPGTFTIKAKVNNEVLLKKVIIR